MKPIPHQSRPQSLFFFSLDVRQFFFPSVSYLSKNRSKLEMTALPYAGGKAYSSNSHNDLLSAIDQSIARTPAKSGG
jgi:hypothetical protein